MDAKQRKMLLAAGLALTLIVGGTALYETSGRAFAATNDASTSGDPSVQQERDGKPGEDGGKRAQAEFRGIKRAADAIGVTPQELHKQLASGKSMADVAKEKGIPEDTLIAKLADQLGTRVDEAVKAGKLTDEQANNVKQRLNGKLKAMVERKGLPPVDHRAHGDKRGGFGLRFDKVAAVLGIGQDELKQQLKAGKSLAEIAQARGISRRQLLDKLQKEMAPQLERMIDHHAGQQEPGKSGDAKAAR